MLQVSDVKLANAPVSPRACKNIALLTEVYIIDFFVVSDELSEDRRLFNVPNCASGVDGACAYQVVDLRVPIERSKRSRKLVILGHDCIELRFLGSITGSLLYCLLSSKF